MIPIRRRARGRLLIVWISCLYVMRGAVRALTVAGGDRLRVTRRPPPPGLPPPVPRTVPRIPLPFSVRVSEEASAVALPSREGRPRASRRAPVRRVLEPRALRGRPAPRAAGTRGVGPARGAPAGAPATPRPP